MQTLPAHLKARIRTPAELVEKMQRDLNRFHALSERPFYRLSEKEQKELLKLRRLRRGVR